MATIQTNWEDEENNRRVGLDVEYQLVDRQVNVLGVTPTKVCFFEPGSAVPHRSIGVWSETGRALLVRQAIAAGKIRQLQEELQSQAMVELAASSRPDAPASEPSPLSA